MAGVTPSQRTQITYHLVVGTSNINPTITINLKINGTTKHSVVTKNYSVISPQVTSGDFYTTLRTHPITLEATASAGNVQFMDGSTLEVTRIA